MSFSLARTDIASIIGDSITSGFVDPRDAWHLNANFLTDIKATWVGPSVSRGYAPTSGALASPGTFPHFGVNGQAGRKITDVSGAIMSLVAAGSTKAIIQLGVNDAFAGTLNATLTTAVNQIHTDLAAGGVTGCLWIGPFSHGEHWPSGAGSGNDIDVDIDRVDTLLSGLVAGFSGWDYVSWRQTVFTPWEPILNPTNLIQLVFTSDGTHPRYQYPTGMALLIAAVRAKMVLVP